MRTTFNRSSSIFRRGIVSWGQLAVAGVLLFGVMMTGHSYFHQNKIGLYIGVVVIMAGLLNGIVQILVHGNG